MKSLSHQTKVHAWLQPHLLCELKQHRFRDTYAWSSHDDAAQHADFICTSLSDLVARVQVHAWCQARVGDTGPQQSLPSACVCRAYNAMKQYMPVGAAAAAAAACLSHSYEALNIACTVTASGTLFQVRRQQRRRLCWRLSPQRQCRQGPPSGRSC